MNSGWYFYKAAVIARNGTVDKIHEFMKRHTGGHMCGAINLGCDGYKISCTFGANTESDDMESQMMFDRQLHYVHAPRLYSHAVDGDDMGADGWMDFQQQSYGDMSQFTSFMHNKFVMFTNDVAAKAQELGDDGFATLMRMSKHRDGYMVGHVLVPMEGYIWEFVGMAPPECDDSSPTVGICSFTTWEAEECPAAHAVDANLTALSQQLSDGVPSGMLSANSTMWISTHVATSGIESDEMLLNFEMLEEHTQAQITYSGGGGTHSPHCRVATIAYQNLNVGLSGENDAVTLKYVVNSKYQSSTVAGKTWSILEYEDYIGRVHDKYLTRPHDEDETSKWRNWDHWLDQHMGIKWYMDDPDDLCFDKNQDVTAMLLENHVTCGKRAIDGDGDHFYTGTPQSSMAIEFNTECNNDFGAAETNVCTCNRENSNELAFFKGDTDSTGSIDDIAYGCHHDDEF